MKKYHYGLKIHGPYHDIKVYDTLRDKKSLDKTDREWRMNMLLSI